MGASKVTILKLKDYLRTPSVAHAVRASYRPGGILRTHGHDFAECMWIESGTGTHSLNGKRHGLEAGDLWLVTRDDVHSIRAGWQTPLRLVNVAFGHEILERVFSLSELDRLRSGVHLRSPRATEGLSRAFSRLVAAVDSPVFLRRFLLDVLCEAERATDASEQSRVPEWLSTATERFSASSEMLYEGAPAFIELCGRSRDHVNRTVQAVHGESLSRFIGRTRVERAARLLATSDREVTEIAFELGFGTLAWFYRQFNTHYGIPPGRYRDEQLRIAR